MEPDALRGASDWVMETVSPEYKVVTKPEASKRGWVTKQPTGIQIGGDDGRKKVLPLLKQLAQIYKSGGKSTIDYLEVSGLKLPQGGIFNIQLQTLAPEDVRTLDELFDVALDLTDQQQAEVQIVISAPQPDCKLVESSAVRDHHPRMPKKKQKLDLKQHHSERLAKLNAKAPFVLRITEWKDKPIPILVIKERHFRDDDEDARDADGQRRKARPVLIERGSLYGEPQHRCLPVLRRILEPVTDEAGIPLELNRYMTRRGPALPRQSAAQRGGRRQARPDLPPPGPAQGPGPGRADRLPGRPVHPRGGRLLALADHELRPQRQPLGALRAAHHARGPSEGPGHRQHVGTLQG